MGEMARWGEEGEMGVRQQAALYVGAFFDELVRWGVREVVVSPGSRSTALAMVAFELSRRAPGSLRIYVDVDERGASFFALGLAKASGRPVCLVCTSGTALANYYPAVMEAETSRVPLIVLSGDRPLRLQGLGAPQTVDQMKAYGDHVRAFRQMPLPGADARDIAFVRQAAREACLAALGPGALPGGGDDEHAVGNARMFHVKHSESAKNMDCSAACGALASVDGMRVCDGMRTGSYLAAGEAGWSNGSEGEQGDTGMPTVGAPATAASATIASRGCRYMAGPVQMNFQFDEPLTPDLSVDGLFSCGRVSGLPVYGVVPVRQVVDGAFAARLCDMLRGRRVMALAGEGTCETADEAREVIAWARWCGVPLLADLLSGLRSFGDEIVIDNYDNVFGLEDCPLPDVVIRFGRYPISKRCTQRLAAARPLNVVVDVAETRDFNMSTDLFVPCTPLDFVRSFAAAYSNQTLCDGDFLREWATLNDCARGAIEAAGAQNGAENVSRETFSQCASEARANERPSASGAQPAGNVPAQPVEGEFAPAQPVSDWLSPAKPAPVHPASASPASVQPSEGGYAPARFAGDEFAPAAQPAEGEFVRALLRLAPESSCVFSANSMSVRVLDAAYTKADKQLAVLCNRGQNGIDGTVSTALGAAQHYAQTTFLTGDFTMLHDLNALALQRELLVHHGGDNARSIVIVLLNNNGGGIFDMLPQKSEEAYFERLFVVPQDVRFEYAARAFGVPYRGVATVPEFEEAYREFLGTPGISLIEIGLPYSGTKERYAAYQTI